MKLKYFIYLIIILTFSLNLSCSPKIKTIINKHVSSNVHGRELLKIKLSQKAINLAEEIEKICGKPIKEDYDETIEPLAQANITKDGMPTITAKPSAVLSEEIIVHELFHLKMKIRGFPTVSFVKPNNVDKQKTEDLFDFIHLHIFDVIEHKIFYAELRQLGFKPDADRISEIEGILAKGKFDNEPVAPLLLSLRYFRCGLEVNDQPILLKLKTFYQKKGWDSTIKKADKLIEIVNKINPKTPEDEVEAFIQCANQTIDSSLSFSFVRFEEEQYGTIKRKFAKVQLNINNSPK